MKLARLVCSVFAVTLTAGWATQSSASDNEDKASAANAAQATASKTATAMDACCAAKATATAVTAAAHAACAAKATAANAGSSACPSSAKNASMYYVSSSPNGSCAGKTSSAVYTASAGQGSCASKGASVSAVSISSDGASKHAAGHGACASKGASAAAGQCSGHGMAVMAGMASNADCEACFDMATCGDALTAVGAHRQTVRLKNGVMYVFTADSQRDVSAVQAAVARRGDQMVRILSSGDNVKLCGDCKSFRGAIASGKLTREVVNIEGGTLTLITSSDAGLVSKLHAMSDTKVAARIKS